MAAGRIVAIDGPSGAGKSTVARIVARRLGFVYIDTGAMYRAFGLLATRKGIDFGDDQAVRRAARAVSIRFRIEGDGLRTILDGEDVSEAIRTPEMSMAASRFSAHPAVREAMTRLQREMGRAGDVVMEGRDIGTAVFPGSRYKFFLTATETERARRRHAELSSSGTAAPSLSEVHADIRKRDADDAGRAHAPLAEPPDAVRIDSTGMSVDQVVEAILAVVQSGAGAR
jgi:cytidylate kinase